MRFPTIHSFLKWFAPALLAGFIAATTAIATLAQAYPKVKDWVATAYLQFESTMTAPWFLFLMIALIAGYVWALVYTGAQNPQNEASRAYEIEIARQKARDDVAQKHSIERAMAEIQGRWFAESPPRRDRREELREERRLKQLETDKHRRALIASCRDLAHEFTLNSPEEQFRPFLEGHRTYADIRSHLSADFLSKLNAVRTTYSSADGARYPALVGWFLDDIDRLEKEWSL